MLWPRGTLDFKRFPDRVAALLESCCYMGVSAACPSTSFTAPAAVPRFLLIPYTQK